MTTQPLLPFDGVHARTMQMTRKEIREDKQYLRRFMREHYSDERLAMLLAHAQSGRLAYNSCCCFIGVANAPHALCGHEERGPIDGTHHRRLQDSIGLLATAAEMAFCRLCRRMYAGDVYAEDAVRRRILIPMIRAEMKRRELLRDLCTDPACRWAKASPAGCDHNISDHEQLAEAG